jgi:hypothetical protein
MHPTLLRALASQRAAEMLAAASSHHQPALFKPTRPIRHRIGWALVQVGLRLAVGRERA